MECNKDQLTAVRRENGRFGGYRIANLADHNHVRALTNDAAQQFTELWTIDFVCFRLSKPSDAVFNRIFNRVNLTPPVVEVVHAGVHGRGFTGTSRAGDNDQSARIPQQRPHDFRLWADKTKGFDVSQR